MKKALVTGIAGQDGSYLAEFLLSKGYEVHGLLRRGSRSTTRIDHLIQDRKINGQQLFLHSGDLSESKPIAELIRLIRPDEIYNLGAQSQVQGSFDTVEETADSNATGVARLLDAIVRADHPVRFLQASSSEMFGRALVSPQNESTAFHPRNPYACAKVFAHWLTVNYRETRGIHASSGISYNHESPRRGEFFVTRKITRGLARIVAGKQKEISLGNLEAVRDWGYAKDFVEAMWMMVQAPQADDYVIATGEPRSIREFLDQAFGLVGIDWKDHVKVDPQFYRPAETFPLVGDISKIRTKLGWTPKTPFAELVRLMVEADLRLEGLDPSKILVTHKEAA